MPRSDNPHRAACRELAGVELNAGAAAKEATLPVFFVTDASGHMRNEPGAALAESVVAAVRSLWALSEKPNGVVAKAEIIEVSTTCSWKSLYTPEDLDDYRRQCGAYSGLLMLGSALDMLGDRLKEIYAGARSGEVLPPVVVFVVRGYANDDVESAMARLQRNEWFQKALRVGFALGLVPYSERLASIDLVDYVGPPGAIAYGNDHDRLPAIMSHMMEVAFDMYVHQRHQSMAWAGGHALQKVLDLAGAGDGVETSYKSPFRRLDNSLEPEPEAVDGGQRDERPILPIFFVLDTSGSMRGVPRVASPIDDLRKAMRQTAKTLAAWDQSTEVQLKMATLAYDSQTTWALPYGLSSVREQDPTSGFAELSAGGLTAVGKALSKLDDKLTASAFLETDCELLPAVIVFMTDGFSTDDYEQELGKILQNPYFRNAIRVGCAYGEQPDSEMVAKVAGDADAVIRVKVSADLRHLFAALSLAAVRTALVAHAGGKVARGSNAVDTMLDFVPDDCRVNYEGVDWRQGC